jgi:predicted TIM-barrel fold metal-dependent hydrolase
MNSFFTVTDVDKMFFDSNLKNRIPEKIIDAHTHLCLPENVKNIPQSRIDSDWALQCGSLSMTVEEARYYTSSLFPDVDYQFTALPMVIKEADTEGNNDYIAEMLREKKVPFGLLGSRPETKPDRIEKRFMEEGFAGLKPYPDFVASYKGADVSIFDFLPKSHLSVAEKYNKCIVLHLPRSGRFPDQSNIRELKLIASEFPNLKIVIAHLGRCFNPVYFERAVKILGDDIHHFWFDTSAVLNSEVHALAMDILHEDRIFFGLDMPALLWHGKRRWTETTYINLCREDFPWNKHVEGKAEEEKYTFFVYEQINNILNTMETLGKNRDYKERFFYKNAFEFFGNCR